MVMAHANTPLPPTEDLECNKVDYHQPQTLGHNFYNMLTFGRRKSNAVNNEGLT